MICANCSTNVPAGSSYCPKCGQALSENAKSLPGQSPAAQLRERIAEAATANDTEQELWHGGYSPKAMIGYWLLAGVVTIAAIVVSVIVPLPVVWLAAGVIAATLWIVFACYLGYERLSVEYTLTNQRFVHKSGILRRKSNRVEVIDIDDVTYEQGLVERMMGVGTIKLLSSDVSDPKLTLRGIDDVQRIANLIDSTRREERRKRGLHIETV